MMFPLWLKAGFWGLFGGSALLLGSAVGYYAKIPQRLVAAVMAFGAGVLISALAFELMDKAYKRGGFDSTAIGFVSGAVVYTLKAYLVLTTKYRRKIFTDVMLKRLHVILEDLLSKWDCKLVEFNGEEDHVHLLFQYHPDLQLSTLVGNIKSTTSRRLRQEFTDHLKRFYTKHVLWNGSYFIASCGGVTITTLKQYIQSQDRPESGDSSLTPVCDTLRERSVEPTAQID